MKGNKTMKDKLADLGCLGITLALLLVLILAFAVGAFEAWIVTLLWNAVLVTLFPSLPTLSFWLAWGLMILCNILFKSISVSTKRD